MRTKITGRYIIGFDGSDHVIFHDGEIVYERDSIIFVGHNYSGPVDKTIDAGNVIVSPGFIDLNALGDIDHDILHFETKPDITSGLIWSEAYALGGPREAMTAEEEIFKNRYAFVQLIRHGITTAMPITSVFYKEWARTYEELEQTAAISAELGLRTYLGPSYQSGIRVVTSEGSWKVWWDSERGEKGLQRAVDFVRDFDGTHNGLIRGFLAPERIETITPDLLQRSKQFSDELTCPIRLHAAQGAFEYQEIRKRHNTTPIGFLASLDFLGSRTFIPHTVYTSGSSYVAEKDQGDLKLLSDSGTTVIHCPLIMARHGMALESVGKYARAGIRIGMGTDTFPPDMIQNMRIGMSISKIIERGASACTSADFFRMATIGGANALGRDDLGRLAPGAKADMIIIDLDDLHIGTMDDPIRTMVLNASGADVKTSIINGRIVMQDRKISGIDVDAMHEQAQNYFEKMKHAYSERDYLRRPVETLFPPSFRTIVKQAIERENPSP